MEAVAPQAPPPSVSNGLEWSSRWTSHSEPTCGQSTDWIGAMGKDLEDAVAGESSRPAEKEQVTRVQFDI